MFIIIHSQEVCILLKYPIKQKEIFIVQVLLTKKSIETQND